MEHRVWDRREAGMVGMSVELYRDDNGNGALDTGDAFLAVRYTT